MPTQPLTPLQTTSLVVLIHGLGGSHRTWLEDDDYTHGARLTRQLTRHGLAWIAPDLYGHGEWRADEPDFDAHDVSDALWPLFINRSVSHFGDLIRHELVRKACSHITLVSYSAGSCVLAKLAQGDLGLSVDRIVMAVPVPYRDMDDEYSLHRNPDAFSGKLCYIYGGEVDEEVPLPELRWWFSQLDAQEKLLRIYPAGHALPSSWVDDVLIDLRIDSV